MESERKMQFVRKSLTAEELLIQLAEECAELSQACLKIVRVSGNNPPKGNLRDLDASFTEELADVQLCMAMLPHYMKDDEAIENIKEHKLNRWCNRLRGDWEE